MESTEARRKRVKPKVLKESALVAGLAAFEALESAEHAARPVQATARTLVEQGIESIMRLRARGVPLLRIYNDARKAAGLRISYQTFAGYVSESSKQAGLRPEKAKAEAGPSARTGTGMEPASVVTDAPAPAGEAASMAGGWNCPACPDSKPEMHKGQRYFACPKCGIAYAADQDGNQTQQRFTAN